METIAPDMEASYYEPLINKVFHHDKKIYTLIKAFITESSSQMPYMDSLMLCLLQETVLRLFQHQFTNKKDEHPITDARQYYQDEILNNDLKLEKSRQLICENKYTISEIALKLGFSSIHYFSRAFTQKYHIAPSEYSKTLYKM